MDPREVRGGRQSYKRALANQESKFGKDSEKVKRWKKALSDAGSLSGWHLNDGDESELIQRIVKEISTLLDQTPLHVAMYPVGIDSRVVKLKSMINLESNDGVLMVGLWGKGGIGKTTLAKAFYNAIFRQFDGSSFLAQVRETSRGYLGLVTLQEKLLNNILLPQKKLEVSNVDTGIHQIQHRFHRKKVLVILDDVDDLYQLRALVGEGKWFGNGSRIIVTTRDKQLLTSLGIDQDHVYEVKALNDGEAHELLSKHAFLTSQKLEIRTNLVDSVLNYAKGLPLAFVELGFFLCGRREEEWESTLNKLFTIPNKSINDVFKISYDGLEENEKEIFLHIACFFKGSKTEYIKRVFDSCGFETTIGLKILIERSLITIESGTLQMHDLIQLMGMDIVKQECDDDPGRRSRVWLYDDVLDVLAYDTGDCAVKAIVLAPPELKEIFIGPDAFMKMRRLRLLILRNVHNSFHGPVYVPNWLRYFEWHGAPMIPEFSSGTKKLVGLDMSNCSIPVMPKQLKDFQNLKYINFSECEPLVSMPSLSCTPNVEELTLSSCHNLVEAHESIAHDDKLPVLNLDGCSELGIFPNVLKSKNLQALNLQDCTKFERFPDIPHKFKGLKKLCLERTAIEGLPASIENLVSLESMYLNNCQNLADNCKSLQNCGDLTSVHDFVRRGLPKDDISSHGRYPLCSIVLPEGKMPKWVLPIEEGSVSFMASEDLYDKFLRFALCVVLGEDEQGNDEHRWEPIYEYDWVTHINGEMRRKQKYGLRSLDSDHIQLQNLIPSELWGVVDFGQVDGSHLRFSLTVSGKNVKKWGIRILCKQLEDDLEVVHQDNQLIDPVLLYEVGHESTYSEAQSSPVDKDSCIVTSLH